MKFFSTFALTALLAITASAQHVQIGSPAEGTTIKAGTSINVRIDRPNFQSSAQEATVVIGLKLCVQNNTCLPTSGGLGTAILYSGPFKPVYDWTAPAHTPPYQNFTVFIPSWTRGPIQLGVAHMSFVGASLVPFFETIETHLITEVATAE